jgi:hypothetical protein
MYFIAAALEAASKDEPWEVSIDLGQGQARVLLLLGTEHNDEAARALKLLKRVATMLRGP